MGGCSERTVGVYRSWLDKLRAHVGEDPAALDSVAVVQFFTGLREHSLSASTVHQAYRTLKTFTRWLLATGVLRGNPLAGLSIKMPSILPEVPTEDELRAVLECCPPTLVGARNRAMILTMADAGLRAGEVLRLLVEHWNPPGVRLVMTYRNAPAQGAPDMSNPVSYSRAQPALSSPEIRHYGEPVALVVAETFEQARAAVSLVEVAYTVEPGQYDFTTRRAPRSAMGAGG